MQRRKNVKSIVALVLSFLLILSAIVIPTAVITAANTNDSENLIVNGDFESTFPTGMMYTDSTNITRVNVAQNGDSVTIDGYAAYLRGAGASTTEDLIVELPLSAGDYVLSFDIALISVKKGWQSPFGIASSLKSNGVAYGAPLLAGQTVSVIDNKTNAPATFYDTGATYYFEYAVGTISDLTTTIKFSLDTEQTVYFFVRCSGNARGYVDNINLTKDSINATIVNGDFEKGTLEGFEIYEKTSGSIELITKADAEAKGAEIGGNYAAYGVKGVGNQQLIVPVTLKAGEYIWTYDAYLLGNGADYAVACGVAKALNTTGKAYYTDSLINTDTTLGEITEVKDNSGSGAIYYKASGACYKTEESVGTAIANPKRTVTVNFTLKKDATVYLWTASNCSGGYCADNFTLTSKNQDSTNTNYDFEDGKTDKIAFTSNIDTIKNSTSVSDECAHGGTKSLKSIAVADKSFEHYQAGRMALPIVVEKNKYYKTTFWIRIDGSNTEDSVGFRISNKKLGASGTNSIISNNSSVYPSAELTLNPSSTEWKLNTVPTNGWLGFIQIMNTNTADSGDWVEVSVKYASGDLEEVYLEFLNFYRAGTVFFVDDVVTVEIDSLLEESSDYDFEDGKTNKIAFTSNIDTLKNSTAVSDEYAHGGTKSLKSTAVADKTFEHYQAGRMALPIAVENNKYYKTTFWIRIDGSNAEDSVGFRISNKELGASGTNSIISNNSSVYSSAELTLNPSSTEWKLNTVPTNGWLGFIQIMNTNTADSGDWVEVSVKYASGTLDKVYLEFLNFYRAGTVFYVDDVVLGDIHTTIMMS